MKRPTIRRRAPLESAERDLIALIGCGGFNVRKRLATELAMIDGHLDIVGFDIRPPDVPVDGIPWVHVGDDHELADRLKEFAPRVVLIETPDDCHVHHIQIAHGAGAQLVLCEKCVAPTVEEALTLLAALSRSAWPPHVRIIDHYLLFRSVLDALANSKSWIGGVSHIKITLFESQGVSTEQERSHAAGMAGFLHHVLALVGLWFDLDDLVLVEAAWAKHPRATVPDTYRAIRLCSASTGNLVVEGAVGKYMAHPRKVIELHGPGGRIVIDRDANTITVCNGHAHMLRSYPGHDSGYRVLLQWLADRHIRFDGQPGLPLDLLPSSLLTVQLATRVLQLIEEADAIASELSEYPTGPHAVFPSAERTAVCHACSDRPRQRAHRSTLTRRTCVHRMLPRQRRDDRITA